ncbi:Asp-tRNA(Asn)/Glu-tRNA(Gln) amidotransferase subunit GatC [Halorubrum laminariae]|uniref:Aspartyl/glutamyl-tRNA(Asn/Gln) amidotransferase subunit C n=1 Tax=Halorubrum laminariae TaxID=1433523 RepID=A0ABD6C1N0_9EURY|nr:Asp-tRNA(Asn)/Glu-tRNA(Gln) amidotransferase subunit GatC [Halorubrum laminariae]
MSDTSESTDGGEEEGADGSAVSAAAVDADEVRHVAELARVRLDDEEVAAFVDQFGDILDSFDALDEVPEVDREEDLINVMRPDEIEEGLTQEEVLSNAEETEDGFFVGPKVS